MEIRDARVIIIAVMQDLKKKGLFWLIMAFLKGGHIDCAPPANKLNLEVLRYRINKK